MGAFRNFFQGEPVWTIDEALNFCQYLEKAFVPKYHVALTGSCLYRGESRKDVDIIIYPHSKTIWSDKEVRSLLLKAGLVRKERIPSGYGDTVEFWSYRDRRVDIFVAPGMFADRPLSVK